MRWPFLTALLFVASSVCAAAQESSEAAARWWSYLSEDLRFSIQANLVLTGDYNALVDGEFGPVTYRGLVQFQQRSGAATADGALMPAEQTALDKQASEAFEKLGMSVVTDDAGGVATYAPLGILTISEVQSDGAVMLSTPDGEFQFLIVGWANDATSVDVIEQELLKPARGRIVTYHTSRNGRAVVAGTEEGRTFYFHVRPVGDLVVGIYTWWTDKYASVARLSATFAASYSGTSADLGLTEPTVEAGVRIGAFLLPDSGPDVIALVDDIESGAALDFRQALHQRPQARTLSLSSDGGDVNEGLLIAHEVADRGIGVRVPKDKGCYSACAYIFFAGKTRVVEGELGVHQIYGDGVSQSQTQVALAKILEAFNEFGVPQEVVTAMLRTQPRDMYVFNQRELDLLELSPSNAESDASMAEASRAAEKKAAADKAAADKAATDKAAAEATAASSSSAEAAAMAASSSSEAMAMAASSSEEPAMDMSSSEAPAMTAAEPKLPATGLGFDTKTAAAGSAVEGMSYIGVWAEDAAGCVTVDAGGAKYVVITTSTVRIGSDAACYGNNRPLAADGTGSVTLQCPATGRNGTIEISMPSPESLVFNGSPPLVRCIIETRLSEDLGIETSADNAVAAIDSNTIGSQSLLLEASDSGSSGALPFSGTVDWSKGVDETGQPTLIGKASIPARNLQVDVLIRRNRDPDLSASHLMEINFTVSDSFLGGSIAGLPGVLLKNEELVQGQPLVGASARVVGNSFLFALSAAPEDSTANVGLLTSRKWIDLALIYATGKRAIITLEKDAAAQALFNEVFSAWGSQPAISPDIGM
ncbi:MAG: hypothetical protein ABL879_01615 [Devosia sp.]